MTHSTHMNAHVLVHMHAQHAVHTHISTCRHSHTLSMHTRSHMYAHICTGTALKGTRAPDQLLAGCLEPLCQ